jgi:hypothetical protein
MYGFETLVVELQSSSVLRCAVCPYAHLCVPTLIEIGPRLILLHPSAVSELLTNIKEIMLSVLSD